MKVTVHQPNYLPYLGYFNKVLQCDLFLIYDTAQFVKDKFDNRNKVKVGNESCWLTVPITKDSAFKSFTQTKINNAFPWRKKHWKTIETNYTKTPFFNCYSDIFKKIYSQEYNYLPEASIKIILEILKLLDFEGEIKLCSKMSFDKSLQSTEALIAMLEEVRATSYLSGISGKSYLDENRFEQKNIKLGYQYFKHPIYRQEGNNFLPYMAIIDLLFNEGENSKQIIREVKK